MFHAGTFLTSALGCALNVQAVFSSMFLRCIIVDPELQAHIFDDAGELVAVVGLEPRR